MRRRRRPDLPSPSDLPKIAPFYLNRCMEVIIAAVVGAIGGALMLYLYQWLTMRTNVKPESHGVHDETLLEIKQKGDAEESKIIHYNATPSSKKEDTSLQILTGFHEKYTGEKKTLAANEVKIINEGNIIKLNQDFKVFNEMKWPEKFSFISTEPDALETNPVLLNCLAEGIFHALIDIAAGKGLMVVGAGTIAKLVLSYSHITWKNSDDFTLTEIIRFNLTDLKGKQKLGRGSCGTVYKKKLKQTGEEVAFKLFHKSEIEKNRKREVRCLLKAKKHDNVVHILGAVFGPKTNLIGLVLELMKTSVDQALQKQDWSTECRMSWIAQASTGAAYINALGIIHRDLKPLNMLLDKSFRCVKISDFGLGRTPEDRKMTKDVGSLKYQAPELESDNYSFPVDVFAMGVSAKDILTERPKGTRTIDEEIEKFLSVSCDHEPHRRQLMYVFQDYFMEKHASEITIQNYLSG